MAVKIGIDVGRLLDGPNLASLATVDATGAPRVQPSWVGRDGETILVNTQEGRFWPRRLRREPRVSMTVINWEEPTEYAEITARFVGDTTEGARDQLDELSRVYIGIDYPNHFEGEVRLILRFEPDKVRYVNLVQAVPGMHPDAVRSS